MNILCINPYVSDFAYYDLYAKPYGLLLIASILKKLGHKVTFIDLPFAENYADELIVKRKKDGTGEFYKEEIKKEKPYELINRKYFRFGLPETKLNTLLNEIDKPDLVLITSFMTYWYPGVRDTIGIVRNKFKNVPIYLGGIYATLLSKHAELVCQPDFVIKGSYHELFKKLSLNMPEINIYPDLIEFYKKLYYIPILISLGCPYNCGYCISKKLNPSYIPLDINKAYEYLVLNSQYFNTDKIAFLDDALLFNKEKHLYLLLERAIKENKKFNFYTPNGLHIRYIDERCAEILYNSGFKKLRLSLEFTDDKKNIKYGNKTNLTQFETCMSYLHKAGFRQDQIGVYILVGIREQRWEDVKRAIDYVYDNGGTPYLSEYSPVYGSLFFEEDKKYSKYDLYEPLYQNNSIFPMESSDFTYENFLYLKYYNRQKRVLLNAKND